MFTYGVLLVFYLVERPRTSDLHRAAGRKARGSELWRGSAIKQSSHTSVRMLTASCNLARHATPSLIHAPSVTCRSMAVMAPAGAAIVHKPSQPL